ncbi:MAG: HEPN domain-containing protein [Chloroflexi bacterium]|nr:HEPN domain-containing protein [Chloroflexota bacterium]
MKRPLESARRWLAEAEHNLQVTRTLLENSLWSKVCFEAEQTAQLALKAFLYGRGRRDVRIHSIGELVAECGKEDGDFLTLLNQGKVLDKYYLSTRYPDALPPPAVPFESFTEEEGLQALAYAEEIVAVASAKIPQA